jgi:hypothetical protein
MIPPTIIRCGDKVQMRFARPEARYCPGARPDGRGQRLGRPSPALSGWAGRESFQVIAVIGKTRQTDQ